MGLTPYVSAADADKIGHGLYIIQCSVASTFAVGKRNNQMTMMTGVAGDRFYVRGPLFFKSYAGATISNLPDGLEMREGMVPLAATGGGGAPKIDPPGES